VGVGAAVGARNADFALAVTHFDFTEAGVVQHRGQFAHQIGIDLHSAIAARFYRHVFTPCALVWLWMA
jgi:hypothetical protein